MRFELVNPKTDDTKTYWNIYKESFPIEEQKPIAILKDAFLEKAIDMWLIKDEVSDELVGLMIIAKGKRAYLLNYLAITPNWQGHGIGSQALRFAQDQYSDLPIVLEIEDTQAEDISAQEAGLRLRRKKFYERQNFVPLPFKSEMVGVIYEILSDDVNQTPEDYIDIFVESYGVDEAELITIIES